MWNWLGRYFRSSADPGKASGNQPPSPPPPGSSLGPTEPLRQQLSRWPAFDKGNERNLDRCFSFLRSVVQTFALAILVWAFAAGAWRGWRTVEGGNGGDFWPFLVAADGGWSGGFWWFGLVAGGVFYTLGALGIIGLVALAAALVGALFGFLWRLHT